MYKTLKEADEGFPMLKEDFPRLENQEAILKQIVSKFDSDGFKKELEKESINLHIDKPEFTGGFRSAFADLLLYIADASADVALVILSSYLYNKFKSEGRDRINYSIYVRTEKR